MGWGGRRFHNNIYLVYVFPPNIIWYYHKHPTMLLCESLATATILSCITATRPKRCRRYSLPRTALPTSAAATCSLRQRAHAHAAHKSQRTKTHQSTARQPKPLPAPHPMVGGSLQPILVPESISELLQIRETPSSFLRAYFGGCECEQQTPPHRGARAEAKKNTPRKRKRRVQCIKHTRQNTLHLVCILRLVLVLVSLVQLCLRRPLSGFSALDVLAPAKELVSLALPASLSVITGGRQRHKHWSF